MFSQHSAFASSTAFRNYLLNAPAEADLAAFRGCFEPVPLRAHQTLYAAGEPIRAAYFVESGYVSVISRMEDGESTEIGLIGREGMVGVALVLEADADSNDAIVQAEGIALRISAARLRQHLAATPGLQRVLLRYALAFQGQVSQTAVCNVLHPLQQRLARWLLMAHDRMGSDTLPTTHDILSMMLGVRRASITVAAGALREAGLIEYGRGPITIRDRAGLVAAACECHGMVRRNYARLLPGKRSSQKGD